MEYRRLSVLLVAKDETTYASIRQILSKAPSHAVNLKWTTSHEAAWKLIDEDPPDACLLHYDPGGREGLGFLQAADDRSRNIPIIVLADGEDLEADMEAMQAGASDYLVAGEITASRLERSIRHAVEQMRSREALARAKKEWELTFDAVPDLIAILDADHRIVRINRAMAERLGMDPKEAVGLKCYECIHNTTAPPPFCPHSRLLMDGECHSAEVREESLGGDFVVTTSPFRDSSNAIVGSVHVARDITALRRAEESFRTLVLSAPIGIYIIQGGKFKMVNPGFLAITGYSEDELIERESLGIVMPEFRKSIRTSAIRMLKGQSRSPHEFQVLTKSGEPKWVMETLTPTVYQGKRACLGYFMDITERKRAEKDLEGKARELALSNAQMHQLMERLQTYSFIDELTGLCNRRGFFERAEEELKMARRIQKKIAIHFADLDGMKWINDHFGHKEGDRALIDTAQILKNTFRETDIIARLGGDEFAIAAIVESENDTAAMLARLQKNIDDHNAGKKRPYELSISVGAVFHDPRKPTNLDRLISAADRLMYREKQKKKME